MRSKWLISLGALLVVLSLVWNFAIFPSMAKMPADYDQEYAFEGSVQVFVAAAGGLVTIPTTMDRTLTATDVTEDDILLLRQDIVFYEATSGMPLGAINPALAALDSTEVYGLDRTTRANVSGNGDANRSGQFTFPADVQQETYQYWSSSTASALPATFVSEETYQGINVYVFEINSTGNPYFADTATGLPQKMDVYAKIRVDPVSGIPVFATSTTTIILQHPVSPFPVLINTSTFTSDTVDEMVDLATSTGNLLQWAGVYAFWGVLGLGVILTAGGVLRSTRGS
ncbi:MAG: porin PorA family protein [Dehalococcoidales bacterium]